jgi:predicted protein tyrosine phosphatase
MKILCICNQGENRSRTAAEMLSQKTQYEVRYDGFFKDRFEEVEKTREKFDSSNLDWADKIIVFEESHEDLLKKYGFTYWGKSYNFHIDDYYHYNQDSLKKILQAKFRQYGF